MFSKYTYLYGYSLWPVSPLVKLGVEHLALFGISVNLELNEKNYFTELLFFSLLPGTVFSPKQI